MFQKALVFIALVTVGPLLIILSIANRQKVTLSFDPFSVEDPLVSLTLPFFLFLFAALMLGVLIGGVAVWMDQRRYRKAARKNRWEAARWHREADKQKERAEELAGRELAFPQQKNRPALTHPA